MSRFQGAWLACESLWSAWPISRFQRLTGASGAGAIGERQISLQAEIAKSVVPPGLNDVCGGKPNYVRTAKFTPITWLPLSLFNQFKRTANVYFLFIAVIVLLGTFWIEFSPKDWRSKIGPFCFVLLWTALKDLYEDLRRRNDDNKENAQVVQRYCKAKDTFEDTCWSDILVGDLLLIRADEPFPADLVLLQTHQMDASYISTVMLDGETNLKERIVPKVLSDFAQPDALSLGSTEEDIEAECFAFVHKLLGAGAEVHLGQPNPVLADVRGVVKMQGNEDCPLGEANFLPRGCMLRNSPFVIAVCAYVGADTKARLNATKATLRFSGMQKALNSCIKILLVFVVSISLFATIMSEVDVFGGGDNRWNIAIVFLRFNIAFYHAVPMSLYVVYEMLKLVLGYQVNIDSQMIHDGEGATARTADLMEELGQVDFVLSDKTGTLTANEMVFARCHVDGEDFGDFRRTSEEGPEAEGILIAKAMMERENLHGQAIRWFFTCLGLCNEVVLEKTAAKGASEPETVTYTGMSPDEVALVEGARSVGVALEFRGRRFATSDRDNCGGGNVGGGGMEADVRDFAGKLKSFKVVANLQFTSDRKRMSVVLLDQGKAWCITKGADSVMEGRLEGGLPSSAAADVLKFSQAGLRVLVVAYRQIEPAFLESWLVAYDRARGILDDTKDAKLAEVVATMEQGLTFAGVTAVEDRLQDGVPEAIDLIMRAGARVWVLTGDKTETAVNIAKSCKLFGEHTKLAYITDCGTVEQTQESLEHAHQEIAGVTDSGLVIDGGTMTQALGDAECRSRIYQLGISSRSCVCSRLSPMQKLQIVKLVREADPRLVALTVGDGANDVPMLLGGNVGIGIRGNEGAAAVQVCDIAISQFRFLVPLMLCHGRRAYRRVAVFFCYYLYKNLALLVADLVWMNWDGYNANIAFAEYLSIGFNAFFTSWHILFVLGFDWDLPDCVSCVHPELYKVGPRNELFNARVFAVWMCHAVLHGAIAWIIPFAMIGPTEWGSRRFWTSSTCAFTNIVHIVLLKLIIVSQNPTGWMTLWPTFGAWAMYVCYLWGLCYTPLGWSVQPNMRSVAEEMFATSSSVLSILLGPLVALSVDIVERLVQRYKFPTDLQKISSKCGESRVAPFTADVYKTETG